MHRSSDPGPDRSRPGAGHPVRLRPTGRDGLQRQRGQGGPSRQAMAKTCGTVRMQRCPTDRGFGFPDQPIRDMASGNSGKSKEPGIQWLGGIGGVCRKVAEKTEIRQRPTDRGVGFQGPPGPLSETPETFRSPINDQHPSGVLLSHPRGAVHSAATGGKGGTPQHRRLQCMHRPARPRAAARASATARSESLCRDTLRRRSPA
jgi:hypothetical protein